MEPMNLVNEIMKTVDRMIDPHADIEQRIAQMRAQVAALSQLPQIIQQKMDAVTRQIDQFSQMESFKEIHQESYCEISQPLEIIHPIERAQAHSVEITEIETPNKEERYIEIQKPFEYNRNEQESPSIRVTKPSLTEEELGVVKREEVKQMLEQKVNVEEQKISDTNMASQYNPVATPQEITHPIKIEKQSEIPVSVQVPQRPRSPSPRPQPVFGPAPAVQPLQAQGARKWKRSHEEYDEELIQETLTAQAEVIKGKAIGVNFMKYEKPPPALDHLRNSEVYKLIHNADEAPVKKVEMLRPVIAEADYRERARSMSPCPNGR